MTYNNLIDLLKKFADDHLQLNDFGRGDIAEVGANRDLTYPILWVPTPDITYSSPDLRYAFQLILADLIYQDKSNELDVQSDMIMIGIDAISYLKNNPDFDFVIEPNANFQLITDRFGDLTACCVVTFYLRDPKPLDRCVIPF